MSIKKEKNTMWSEAKFDFRLKCSHSSLLYALLFNPTLRSLLRVTCGRKKNLFGFINCTSYILTTKLKTIKTWIIMFSNHEPSRNQCLQSKKHKRTRPLPLTPPIIPSIVTGEPQHTEELWESEFSGWLKCEVMLLQRGQVMQFVP